MLTVRTFLGRRLRICNATQSVFEASSLAIRQGVHVETQLVDLHDVVWELEERQQIVQIFGHFEPSLRKKTLDAYASFII